MSRPLPDVDAASFAPFWQGAHHHLLRVPRCSSCGTHRWPPRPLCPVCHTFETAWSTVSARGNLYSWTVVHHQTVPELATPYAVALVTLDRPAGIRFLGRVVDTDPDALRIGMAMEAVYETVDERVTLVHWRAAHPTAAPGPRTPDDEPV